MDDKTLDHIFKTTFSTKGKTSREEGDWDDFEQKLKKRLNKRGFFYFKWNRFNIYYVGIILTCLISGFIYSQNYLWNKPTSHNEQNNTLSIDSSYIQSNLLEDKNALPGTQDIKTSGINENKKQNQFIQKTTSSTTDLGKDPVSPPITNTNVQDTVSAKEQTSPPALNTPPVVVMRRKKTIVMTTPQDTVIKIDTVKIKKGRKR